MYTNDIPQKMPLYCHILTYMHTVSLGYNYIPIHIPIYIPGSSTGFMNFIGNPINVPLYPMCIPLYAIYPMNIPCNPCYNPYCGIYRIFIFFP